MYSYEAIRDIYVHMQDETSKFIFLKRLKYSLSGENCAIEEIVDREMERYALEDMMNRLLVWLQEHSGKIVLFGAGFAGSQICSLLRRREIKVECIADNNKALWGQERYGIKIISPEKIDKNSLVIIGINSHVKELQKQLLSLGIAEETIFMLDRQWWIGNHPQYFAPEIAVPGENEIFVDGGSLDGGDGLNFIKWSGGQYKAVYAFEPDAVNYEKLCHIAEQYQGIKTFQEGLWNDEGKLCFMAGSRETCAVCSEGNVMIQVTSIDKKLKGLKPTFIKMDIEGSELEALCGSEETIRKYKPRLAICVYHKPEDIIDIPQKILEMNPEYRLYLRHYSYTDTETVLYAV